MKVGARVCDRWWPLRVGVVRRVLKTRVHVEWLDGGRWVYDAAHLRFLEAL